MAAILGFLDHMRLQKTNNKVELESYALVLIFHSTVNAFRLKSFPASESMVSVLLFI
jgi:hypothetical protein